MTSVMEKFDSYWSGGDPDVRDRYIIKTINPMLFLVTSYVLFVKVVGPYLMRYRKPIEMRPLIIVYNFSLVAFYVWYLLRGTVFLYEMGFSMFCGPLVRSRHPIVPEIFVHAVVLYYVRFIELLDTAFLVLSKKFNMVTSLHVFHHSIVPVFGWFALRSETSGYLALFMGVNCFVHVFMYSYYAIAALGPKYQKYLWWKQYLTTLQITQFFVMTIYMSVMYLLGCVTSELVFWLSTFLSVLFFFWFIQYYRTTYKTMKTIEAEKNGVTKTKDKLQVNGVHKNGSLNRNTTKKKE